MRYLISILLIIIVIFFAFLKPKYESTDILDLYVITLGKEERIANVKNQETKIGKKINIYNGVIELVLFESSFYSLRCSMPGQKIIIDVNTS